MGDCISSGYYLDLAIKEWETKCKKNKKTGKHEHQKDEPYNVWVCKHCDKVVYPK